MHRAARLFIYSAAAGQLKLRYFALQVHKSTGSQDNTNTVPKTTQIIEMEQDDSWFRDCGPTVSAPVSSHSHGSPLCKHLTSAHVDQQGHPAIYCAREWCHPVGKCPRSMRASAQAMLHPGADLHGDQNGAQARSL